MSVNKLVITGIGGSMKNIRLLEGGVRIFLAQGRGV